MASPILDQSVNSIQRHTDDTIEPFNVIIRSLTKEQRRALRILLSFPGTTALLKKQLGVMQ